MFPYTCIVCGGAYNRCGNSRCDPNCEGGQMCWEDECYVTFKNNIKEGIYDGYGIVKIKNSNKIYIPIEFEEFINIWYSSEKEKKNIILCDNIICKSCYMRKQ